MGDTFAVEAEDATSWDQIRMLCLQLIGEGKGLWGSPPFNLTIEFTPLGAKDETTIGKMFEALERKVKNPAWEMVWVIRGLGNLLTNLDRILPSEFEGDLTTKQVQWLENWKVLSRAIEGIFPDDVDRSGVNMVDVREELERIKTITKGVPYANRNEDIHDMENAPSSSEFGPYNADEELVVDMPTKA